jgi:hypothetical protein
MDGRPGGSYSLLRAGIAEWPISVAADAERERIQFRRFTFEAKNRL